VPTKRSAIAFARGARTGVRAILMSMAVKTASKAAVNLAYAVADQEPEAPVGVVEVHDQVAGLLGQPCSGRVGGDAQDVHPAGGVLDDEERVEPVQGDRVEVKQVAGQDRMCLRLEELRPGRIGPPRRGIDPERYAPWLRRAQQWLGEPLDVIAIHLDYDDRAGSPYYEVKLLCNEEDLAGAPLAVRRVAQSGDH
jgi:hypothetical protein